MESARSIALSRLEAATIARQMLGGRSSVFVGPWTPQHDDLSDSLDDSGIGTGAECLALCLSRIPIGLVQSDFDELMRRERAIDLGDEPV